MSLRTSRVAEFPVHIYVHWGRSHTLEGKIPEKNQKEQRLLKIPIELKVHKALRHFWEFKETTTDSSAPSLKPMTIDHHCENDGDLS